jgi:HAD superfamily hydrolase (TIGR01509 family)
MTLRALIFDCDGVLADTERDGHRPAFNHAFAELGVPVQWGIEEYGTLLEIGGGKERMATLFDGPLRGSHWDAGTEVRTQTLATWHAAKTRAYVQLVRSGAVPARPGVARLATEADAAGVTLAVASTSAEASVRAVLCHVVGERLARRFAVYAGDIVERKKPAPDIYLAALEGLGVAPEYVVAIEDSGIGCQAAIAAGLTTVITTSAYTEGDDFSGAALVVPDLGEPKQAAGSSGIAGSGAVVDLALLRVLLARRFG